MKSSVTKYLILVFTLSVLASGCTSSLRMQVLQPAAVYVHPEIKTLVLVNRTKPISKVANVLEGVLTGEGLHQDKDGIANSLQGLNYELRDSPRFKTVVTDEYLTGSGAGTSFPPGLDWKQVEELCKKYNSDALCTVETYDSDTRIQTRINVLTRRGSDGKDYKYNEFVATQAVTVQIGFRLYDPVTQQIIDQYHFTEQNNWTSKGATEAQAIGGLINKRAATNQVSNSAGVKYAIRIAPSWIWITRNFYTKSNKSAQMKKAGKLGKINKWAEARALWETLLNEEKKIPGKAAYNIAISYEYEGNLTEAKKWAEKSYTDYGNKMARDYIRILDKRIQDCNILENQMRGVE